MVDAGEAPSAAVGSGGFGTWHELQYHDLSGAKFFCAVLARTVGVKELSEDMVRILALVLAVEAVVSSWMEVKKSPGRLSCCSCQTNQSHSFLLPSTWMNVLLRCGCSQKIAMLPKTTVLQFPPPLLFSPSLRLPSPRAGEGHRKLETCRHVNVGLSFVRAGDFHGQHIYRRRFEYCPVSLIPAACR